MKKTVSIIVLFALVLALTACSGSVTVVSDKSSDYIITLTADDNATVAAAEYLATKLYMKLDAELPLVYESEITTSGAIPEKEIIIGESLREFSAENEEIPQGEYRIALKGEKILILAGDPETLFKAVKAIADKWVSEDCGVAEKDCLIINKKIINDLSGLDITLNDTIKILSQNMRYTNDPDGNSIAERAQRFLKLLKQYQPDLIGTQETTKEWMTFFKENLSDTYEMIGCSRNGSKASDGEWNTILYRKDRFELIEGDTFWLSETPDEDASKLEESSIARICTWTALEDKISGKVFTFNNTHLHHVGEDAQVRADQTNILFNYLREEIGYFDLYPAFLTGDFNAERDEPAYAVATENMRDSKFTAFKDLSVVDYTFHDYGKAEKFLDYCFHSKGNTAIIDYKILNDMYDGYVSDHYGVLVTAVIGG